MTGCTAQKLRLGILAGNIAALEPWEARLFDKICADDRFELVVVLTGAFDGPLQAQSTLKSSFADRIFKFDTARLARTGAYHGHSFDEALTKTKVWLVTPAYGKAAGTVNDATITAISDLALDVLLVNGLDELGASLSQYAKSGAWWLQFAGQRLQSDSIKQAIACLELGPLMRVALVARTDNHSTPRVISSASFNTEKSPAATLMRTAEKSVSLVWRALHRLAATGRLEFEQSADQNAGTAPALKPSRPRDALRYGGALTGLVSGKITKKLAQHAGRHHMRWSLFFGHGAFDPAILAQTHEVTPAKGEFWADPFLIEKNGATFVFFENYVYATGLGKISVGIFRNGALHVIGDALETPYHLSFPLVFEHGGDIYMMPETCGAQRVEIWRAVEFPLRWERFSTALEGQSVADPVLLHDDNRWWLFANISTTPFEDHCNELHVFEVDGPALKRVTPHPLNPVVIGSDSARNAGRIVRRDGKLLRLSQNNSHGIYGYGLNVIEITQLDAGHYQERRMQTVEPNFKPGLIGCHHMDQCGDVFVVDACRRLG